MRTTFKTLKQKYKSVLELNTNAKVEICHEVYNLLDEEQVLKVYKTAVNFIYENITPPDDSM